jgi:hypothetical protein
MNVNKCALASVVAAVFLFLYGWIVYGLLLSSYVTRISPPGSMLPAGSEHLGLVALGCLIQGAALTWIFIMGRKGPGVMEGVRFGLAIGALIFGIYVLMAGVSPYTLRAALTFAIIDTVMYVGAGALIAGVYKA